MGGKSFIAKGFDTSIGLLHRPGLVDPDGAAERISNPRP
jgi:hypothetical protein